MTGSYLAAPAAFLDQAGAECADAFVTNIDRERRERSLPLEMLPSKRGRGGEALDQKSSPSHWEGAGGWDTF
jgi:hypothetical protein